jgi:hypothetical protein
MSIGRKLLLGASAERRCENCSTPLTVPLWTLWLSFALVLAPVPYWTLGSWVMSLGLLAVELVVLAVVQVQLVPLVNNAT